MFTRFKRVLKFAINDLGRNKGILIASIFVLLATMMLVSGIFFFHGIMDYLITQIQNKIEITVYFKEDVKEEDILMVRDEIIKDFPEIKKIQYISKEQAMADFKKKHKDNPILMRALQEVGKNPLLSSLNIITNGDPLQYESISKTLQISNFSKMIEKIDFFEKKDTINKIYSIISKVNIFGIISGFILVLMAVLVVFSTIKLTIENSKEEISTMRIVGASDWFIKGPFVIQGVIYGIIAFSICFFLSGIISYCLKPQIEDILPGFNVFNYFLTNWWIFVLIQLGFGVGVGVLSALIGVKKYLDI